MPSIQNVFHKCRTGVGRICIESSGERIGIGSCFLVDDGIVTNSHVIRRPNMNTFEIWFETERKGPIRFIPNDVITIESTEDEADFAYIKMNEPEFNNRYRFNLMREPMSVGQKIGFMGFPFGTEHLTCHVGYISSTYSDSGIDKYQIDGSVNSGNSGGPAISIDTAEVFGIITRAENGIVQKQFDELVSALRKNQELLSRLKARQSFNGVNIVRETVFAQDAIEKIAHNLRRSANVGIGIAFSISHFINRLNEL